MDADGARLVVMCFDQDRDLISEGTTPVVRASGQSLMWNATARWWQSSVEMDDETFTRQQVIRLGDQVTAWNRSGIAINLAAGTVRARVTKA